MANIKFSDIDASITSAPAPDDIIVYIDDVAGTPNPGITLVSTLTRDSFIIPVSDETTPFTTGDNKFRFFTPYAFNITEIHASVNSPTTTGTITIDVEHNGISVFTTLLTIDATEQASNSAAIPAVIDAAQDNWAAWEEIGINIDGVGDGTAYGLKVYIIGYPTLTEIP